LIDILLCFCFSAQFASQLSIFEAFRPVEVAGNIGTAYLPMKVESDVLIWSCLFAGNICWKVIFYLKVNSEKVNYFLIFDNVMKNKLENIFQCLVMS